MAAIWVDDYCEIGRCCLVYTPDKRTVYPAGIDKKRFDYLVHLLMRYIQSVITDARSPGETITNW